MDCGEDQSNPQAFTIVQAFTTVELLPLFLRVHSIQRTSNGLSLRQFKNYVATIIVRQVR